MALKRSISFLAIYLNGMIKAVTAYMPPLSIQYAINLKNAFLFLGVVVGLARAVFIG